MSREEIDRIMNSDFSEVDTTIQKQLQAIDLMTDQLGQKSLFLSQFQKLLQQELITKKQTSSSPIQRGPETEGKEIVLEVDIGLFEDEPHETNSQAPNSSPKEINGRQRTPEVEIDSASSKSAAYYRRLAQKLNSIRLFANKEAQLMKEYFLLQKQQILTSFKEALEAIGSKFRQQYQGQLTSLSLQNHQLKRQLQSFRKKEQQKYLNPLSKLPREVDSQNIPLLSSTHIVNQSKPDLSNKKKAVDPVPQGRNKQSPLSVICESSTKHFSYASPPCLLSISESITGQRRYSQSRKLQKCPDELLSLPDIKPLNVGIAPVQNGFGVLALGATIVYRGMWKQGKFSGKGNLTWNNYSYEGDFQNGVFSGFGKLRIDAGTYMGKFVSNRAEGEGTFESQTGRVSGLWRNNYLIKPY